MNALELYEEIREEIWDNYPVEEISTLSNVLQKYRKIFDKHPQLMRVDPKLQSKIEQTFIALINAEMHLGQLLDEQMLHTLCPEIFGLPARDDTL